MTLPVWATCPAVRWPMAVMALAAGLCCWDGCVAGSLFPRTEGWGLA